uniref:Phosphocholine transferase AnkX n=1 Tax=Wolbachia endosymbiont of Aleurodicus dispersus TaxID=1288877 RepID=A0A3B0IWG2_9RICK
MFKNTVTSVFKAKSSTSAKTLSSGLFAAGTIGMARAISKIDLSSLQGNSEDKVNKQDLIIIYDYINKVTQEENYNICTNNLDCIKSRILAENISDSLAEKFRQDGWNITSDDGSSLLTVAIERIGKEQKKNRNYDIHVKIAVSLILGMDRELIIKLENFADSNDKTLLHYLAELGKEDILRFVIENSNFDIEEALRNKDRDGKTPLHYAAKSGNKECFKTLMENEAHFTTTINYKSELHYAARSGNFSFLEYLGEILKAKGIFDREKIKTDKYGNNALHYAAQSGNDKCIEFCINNQVQFLKNQYNENPLHKIAGNSETQKNAIGFLIEHLQFLGRLKSEINREDVDGNTPLHIAAKHGNKQLMKLFTQSGAKIVQNKQGNNPLHIAIIHGNAYCIELFHKNTGNGILESKGEHGRDLVHLAAMYGKYDCLTFLLNKFPDYDLSTETRKGNMALHLALSSNTETELRKKCVSLLIDRSMQVNKSNNEGNTPLHFAAQLDLSFLSMIEKKLEEKKFDVYQEVLRENSNGDTVFHMAARVGNKSCLEHLFKKERVEEILSKKNKDEQTLLHLSILSGRVECIKYLVEESPISIFPEQNTQKKLLFAAVLGGNKECLEFVTKKLVDKRVAASTKVLYDENNNTLLHMAALADGIVCSQYIIESTSKSTIRKLFNTNNHKLTPLHLATMTLNAEVIEHFMMDNYLYTEKMLNVVSKSGRTALHYLVMSDNDFEKTINEDFKQDQFLKKLILEKRKQNEHLREKAIKALLYLTTINRGQIINEKINFDIKDNKGKTFLKYSLEYKNISILKLFLDPFYEIRENLKREYDKLELEYQEKSRKFLELITIIMLALNAISYFCIPNDQQSESAIKKIFDFIVMFYSILSLAFMLSNLMIGNKKEPIKRKIESYTEKINSIEEVTGKLAKTIVEVHNSEGYNAILEQLAKNSEDILQVKSMLDKLMHAVSLESRDKLNISSQKMNRRGSTVLAGRRSSSFLGNLGEKLSQYARRNSRMQDTIDRHDSASCLITMDKYSESKPKAPQSKFKTAVNKIKVSNIFGKKENVVNSSQSKFKTAVNKIKVTSILEEKENLVDSLNLLGEKNTTKKDDEEKQPHSYSIFSNPFNPSCSTPIKREFDVIDHANSHYVDLPSMSKKPSSSKAKTTIKEEDFLERPRVQSNPLYMIRKKIIGKLQKSSDHIERVKSSVFSTSSCPILTKEEFGITGYTGNSAVHLKKLPFVSEELPHTTLSSPGTEAIIQEENFFGLEYRPRTQSSPPCMSRRRVAGRALRSRISSDHIRGIMRIVVTDSDGVNF